MARIEDYALIGDLQTAALVSRCGSVDWLCFPRFDSGACFAALLGGEENGRWVIEPAGPFQSVRGRSHSVHADVVPITRGVAAGNRSGAGAARHDRLLERVQRALRLRGPMADDRPALADGAEGADVRADRRDRGGADDVVARAHRW